MYKRIDGVFKSLPSVRSLFFVVVALSEGTHFFIAHHAQATEAPSGLVYQGRIIKPDSTPLESNSVNFDVSVYSADGSCLLYEETHSVNMTGSAGSFALSLGSGISTGPGYTIQQVFSNTGSFTGGGSCSYSPSSGDARQIIVSFNDGSGAVALQSQVVRSVPYALYASKLEGLGRSDFLQINTGTSSLSQSNANTLFQTATYNELIALAGGTSTQFAKASDLPVSSGVLNLSGAGQGVRVLDTPAAGDYAVNKNYTDAYIGGRSIDSTDLASLGNGQSIMWDTTANSGLGGWVKYTPASTSNTVINGGQAGAVSLGPTDANSLTFKTNNTAQMTIDSAGRASIGTATPTATSQLTLKNSSASAYTEASWVNDVGRILYVGFGGSAATNDTNRAYVDSFGYDLALKTLGTNSPSLLIKGSNGRVGIGTPTTTISHLLQIGPGNGSVNLSEPLVMISNTGSSGLAIRNSTNNVETYYIVNGSSANIGTFTNHSLNISTNNSTRMLIKGSGEVGVGTTSPGATLHVNSSDTAGNSVLETLRLSHEDTDSAGANGIGASLTFNLETTTNGTFREAAKIEGVFDDANNNSKDGSLRFYTMGPNAASGTTTTTEIMRINPNGLTVGGTVSGGTGTAVALGPSSSAGGIGAFAVGDSASAAYNWSAAIGWQASAASQHSYAIGSSAEASGYHSVALCGASTGRGTVSGNGSMGLFVGDVTGVDVTTDGVLSIMGGNVGIGTVNPAAPLEVVNPGTTGDALQLSMIGNGVFSHFGYRSSDQAFYVIGDTGNALSLGSNNVGDDIFIDLTHNVGVGIASPSEKLHVLGNLRVQGSTDCTLGNGSGGTNCSSDIRLKEHLEPIDEALSKILSLRGVEFDWNEKSQSPGRHDIGVIAQEVEKVFPTAVIEDPHTGYKKVDYAVLVAPLIEAVKRLSEELKTLSDKVLSQNQRISSLEEENAQMKERLNQIEKALSVR